MLQIYGYVANVIITVVAAAGNNGQDANGKLQWGGIASPGNAPWERGDQARRAWWVRVSSHESAGR